MTEVRLQRASRQLPQAIANVALGSSLRSHSASEPTFVGCWSDSDRRRCNAANAATCQRATSHVWSEIKETASVKA